MENIDKVAQEKESLPDYFFYDQGRVKDVRDIIKNIDADQVLTSVLPVACIESYTVCHTWAIVYMHYECIYIYM